MEVQQGTLHKLENIRTGRTDTQNMWKLVIGVVLNKGLEAKQYYCG